LFPMSLPDPSLPSGMRVYAIGDIHGGLDLLKKLVDKIEVDRGAFKGPVHIIFLGDYIDRGLSSRGVIEYLIQRQANDKNAIFLLGNHEQVMRSVLLSSDKELFENWMSFGGRETLLSYGISPAALRNGPEKLIAELVQKTPTAHLNFLQKLELSASFGDYYFCHAGVRPGIDLAKQREDDLVWIRQEFLGYTQPFGKVVVHGHSIRLKAEFKSNRIGIDTGAYATGRLTALALEGTKKWLLQTA
jgi:serine/threonine protein phosphatase 1